MKEYISPVIANRFPDFVREEYPAFDKFLQDYLAWLEQDEGFLQILNDWKSNMEPSNNVEPYIDAIIRDVGFVFERPITIPKSTLLHFLRDFYLSRGSVQSYKFLFRVLFDEDVRIEYPRDRLLWLSAANYGQRHYVYLKSTHVGSREYEGILNNVSEYAGTLYGSLSQITAFVEGVQPILYNGGEYLKVEIQRPLGEFLPTDLMTLSVSEFSINEQIMSVVSLQIDNPGIGYLPGELVQISGTDVTGTASIGTTSKGGVTNILINDPGCNYKVGDLILARPGFGGSGFTAQVAEVGPTPVTGQPALVDSIKKCVILSQGYEFDRVPDIFPKRKAESMIFDARFEADQRTLDDSTQTPVVPPVSSKGGTSTNSAPTVGIIDLEETDRESPTAPPPEFGAIKLTHLSKIKPCVADLSATSTNIGQIKTINFGAPFIGFADPSDVSISIDSENGTGASFTVKPVTRFVVSGWEDNKGFLGEKCVLLDSDKYQQFSYEIISSVDPSKYQDIVSDLLHPVGYVRSAIVEIEGSGSIGITAGSNAVVKPQVLEFNSVYTGIEPLEFSVGVLDPGNRIVLLEDGILFPIVDENDNEIIWTEPTYTEIVDELGNNIVTSFSEKIVTIS